MYPAVLAAGMAARLGDRAGHGDSLFPDQPRSRTRKPYPSNDFVGFLLGYTVRNQPRLRPGAPPGWRCPQNLARWARALAWMPGPAEVSRAELALDYEAFVGRALLGSPDHRGTRLPLGERPQVLRKAAGLMQRHLVLCTLMCGAPLGRCPSLLPLGGRMCTGLLSCLFFTALLGPARASACPHAAAARRSFSHGLFPSSPQGAVPLNAVCQEAPTGQPGASRSPPRSATALRGRAVALATRYTCRMERRRAPSAQAWARA